jgi:hypothetical protein
MFDYHLDPKQDALLRPRPLSFSEWPGLISWFLVFAATLEPLARICLERSREFHQGTQSRIPAIRSEIFQ